MISQFFLNYKSSDYYLFKYHIEAYLGEKFYCS